MSAIIRFESVSKHYRLQHEQDRPRAFRDIFIGRWRPRMPQAAGRDLLWALREVSFEVQPGEAVGLIGANGAGKTTALKLMSKVIVPNSGRVTVNGQVAALLELGTGFHPDLSGRDNIFLSGALAGMGRAEIKRKFDSIVAFSELEEFMDMPVKHYSSGMFARLAFAVSIHLDPEILLVDEVLAVGDKNFQLKCLERVDEIKRQGRTVILVSHSEDTIRAYCSRAMWFAQGQVNEDGPTERVLASYLGWHKRLLERAEEYAGEAADGDNPVRITGLRLVDRDGKDCSVFETGQTLELQITYSACGRIVDPIFGMAIYSSEDVLITGPNTGVCGFNIPFIEGQGSISFVIPSLPLLNGIYFVSVSAHNRGPTVMYDFVDRQVQFRIVNPPSGVREKFGVVTLRGEWTHTVPHP